MLWHRETKAPAVWRGSRPRETGPRGDPRLRCLPPTTRPETPTGLHQLLFRGRATTACRPAQATACPCKAPREHRARAGPGCFPTRQSQTPRGPRSQTHLLPAPYREVGQILTCKEESRVRTTISGSDQASAPASAPASGPHKSQAKAGPPWVAGDLARNVRWPCGGGRAAPPSQGQGLGAEVAAPGSAPHGGRRTDGQTDGKQQRPGGLPASPMGPGPGPEPWGLRPFCGAGTRPGPPSPSACRRTVAPGPRKVNGPAAAGSRRFCRRALKLCWKVGRIKGIKTLKRHYRVHGGFSGDFTP